VTAREGSTDQLVGGWRLSSWVAIADDGSETFPMGEAADGLLAYAADGTMVTVIGQGDRHRFAGDDVTGGSDAERASAFASYIAYGGRYEVRGDTVIHHVEMSLFPNWIGTDQRRQWELDPSGRDLTLTSPPLLIGGTRRIQRLRWERAGPAPEVDRSG
jgi:hypothetical protein